MMNKAVLEQAKTSQRLSEAMLLAAQRELGNAVDFDTATMLACLMTMVTSLLYLTYDDPQPEFDRWVKHAHDLLDMRIKEREASQH